MSRIQNHAISLCLCGTGVLAWTFAGRPLIEARDLKVPLNPMGINRSPYGEVIAMAMQGPIDTYTDMGLSGRGHVHEDGEECDGHDHAHGEECDHDDHAVHAKADPSPGQRFEKFLTSLGEASAARTNPNTAGEALKRHLRREAEDKLRFAYNLDPSHYANYNTLHFFLTEPAVGTRPELTPTAAKLAEETIQYCLKQENDPRPALTAAAAATNILQLMFEDQKNKTPKFGTEQMRRVLGILDYSLTRYDTVTKAWDASKNWELLSPQRIEECHEHHQFVSRIRDTAEKTILRLEGRLQPQVSN